MQKITVTTSRHETRARYLTSDKDLEQINDDTFGGKNCCTWQV
jgi:hypothetical protein